MIGVGYGRGYGYGYGYGYNNEIWVLGVMMLGEGMDYGRGRDCVLIVCDKIDETCVWGRIENWKYM